MSQESDGYPEPLRRNVHSGYRGTPERAGRIPGGLVTNGEHRSTPPLLGPGGRIPSVDALAVKRTGGVAALRSGWRLRHTIVLLLLVPVMLLGYRAAFQTAADTVGGTALVVAMSLMAALILTTYVPLRGGSFAGTSCALMPALTVALAAFLLQDAAASGNGAFALGVLVLGLVQRLSGTSACG